MATIRPPTRSPGFLNVPYVIGGVEHKLALRLTYGTDPFNAGIMRAAADTLVGFLCGVMPTTHSFTRWETTDALGGFVTGGALTSPATGAHGTNAGMPAYKSAVMQLTGKGVAGQAGYAVGQTRLMWRSINSYPFAPGTKRQPTDAQLVALIGHLNTSIYVWADFFGQKAITRSTPTIQFNAHIQRVEGS